MSFMEGFIKQEMEESRLDILEKKRKSAKIQGLTYCVKCGFCCMRRSCIPSPMEVGSIAKFLKLKPLECIRKYFAIDRKQFGRDYYVKPIGVNQKDLVGKFIPSDRTFNEGACIFLTKDKLCSIYEVRPDTAKECECWNEDKKDGSNISEKWKDGKLLEIFGIDGGKLEEEE